MDKRESVDLFLEATKAGLFEMEWDVVCASCGNIFRSFRSLEKVDPHFRCDLCNMDNSANLDEFIHVTFTISPRIKDIILHHPDQLTIEELLFEFRYSQDVMPQWDGLTLPELMRQWTRALTYLEPGEETTLDVELPGGALVIRDMMQSASIAFFAGPDEPAGDQSITLSLGHDGYSHPDLEISPFEMKSPIGTFFFPKVHVVGPGALNIRCRNDSSKRLSFWAVTYPPFDSFEPQLIEFGPFLSAKQLLNTDTFRRLFRAQTPGAGEGLAVKDLTYLFTDLKGSTAMYDEVGDGTAYNLVRLHFEALGRAVAENNGVIVKTVGDAVMATFAEPANAVSAALAMLENIGEFNSSMSTALELKIGIHRGHSIAVTLNDRLDYFGQNVNIAARTQQQADGGQILISGEVLSDEGVRELLAETTPERVTGLMKGIAEEIPVYRVAGLREEKRNTAL